MITASDLQRVAPKVWARLTEYGQLPPNGTVAGQAVASLFYEELGLHMRGPINDIDVFVDLSLPRELRGKPKLPAHQGSWSSPVRQRTTSVGRKVDAEDYGHVKFIALRSNVKICHTYKAGIFNYTLVDAYSHRPRPKITHPTIVSQELVNGFDLNAVAVGINCANQEVVCSEAFLEFCNTQELKPQTCNTPAHTLVRLAKKYWGQELTNITCDFAHHRAMLETALLCQSKGTPLLRVIRSDVVASFGAKYAATAQQFAAHLPPMSEVQSQYPIINGVSSMTGTNLFSFDLPAPMPNTVWGYMLNRTAHISECLFTMTFVGDFPKIYDLLTAPQTPDIVQRRRALLSSLQTEQSYAKSEGVQPDMDAQPMLNVFNVAAQQQQDAALNPKPFPTPPLEYAPELIAACQELLPLSNATASDLFEQYGLMSVDDPAHGHAYGLDWLQTALGKSSVAHAIAGRTPTENLLLFFDQQSAHNAKDIQDVADICADFTPMHWSLAKALQWRADDVLQWGKNPSMQLDKMLRDGWKSLECRLLQENPQPSYWTPFFAQCRHLLAEKIHAGNTTLQADLCTVLCATTTTSVGYVSAAMDPATNTPQRHHVLIKNSPNKQWSALLLSVPSNQRTQVLEDLCALCVPHWPGHMEKDHVEVLLSLCALHDVSPPPSLRYIWEHAAAHNISRPTVLMNALRASQSNYGHTQEADPLSNGLWGRWFAALSDVELWENDCVLSRKLIAEGRLNMLQARCVTTSSAATLEHLQAVSQMLHEDQAEPHVFGNPFGTPQNVPTTLEEHQSIHPHSREVIRIPNFGYVDAKKTMEEFYSWATSVQLRASLQQTLTVPVPTARRKKM